MMRYIYIVGLILAFALLVIVRLLTLVSSHQLIWLIGSGVVCGAISSVPFMRSVLRQLSVSLDGPPPPSPWYQNWGISKYVAFLMFLVSGGIFGGLALIGTISLGLSRETVFSVAITATTFFTAVWLPLLIAVSVFEWKRGCRVYLVTDIGLCAIRIKGKRNGPPT